MCCNALVHRSQIACVGFWFVFAKLTRLKIKAHKRPTFADFYRHPEPLFSAPKKLLSPSLNNVSARFPILRVPVRSATSLHSKLPSLPSPVSHSSFLFQSATVIYFGASCLTAIRLLQLGCFERLFQTAVSISDFHRLLCLLSHSSEIMFVARFRSWRISHVADTAHHPIIRNFVACSCLFCFQDAFYYKY